MSLFLSVDLAKDSVVARRVNALSPSASLHLNCFAAILAFWPGKLDPHLRDRSNGG